MKFLQKSKMAGVLGPRSRLFGNLTLAAAMLSTLFAPVLSASAETAPPPCEVKATGGPMWITGECVDPQYDNPVIDSETDLTSPVPVHKVSGHFEGTAKKFNFYFPPKSQWQGRFFQYVYPLSNEEAEDKIISFGADSGAYTVQTNGGSGYRVDAAAAKFSKIVAAAYYGTHEPIYGYIWGGSGGSYMTIGAIENASGVWDGAVPFIPAAPTSLPNNFLMRAFARFALADKAPQIADAVSPGGSGDPYAGLDDVERSVLQEVTNLGLPLRAWMDNRYILALDDPNGLLGYASMIKAFDPTYADDFWSKPGYLGTEESGLGDRFRAARIEQTVSVTQVTYNAENVPTSFAVDEVPAKLDYPNPDFTLYAADGSLIGTLNGSLNSATKRFTLVAGNPDNVLKAIAAGDKLKVDNKWSLAVLAYHRHQVPKSSDFKAWDQFKSADGTPIYPQRSIEVGPTVAQSVTGGGTYTGAINGKVIMVSNLLDVDAYPWDGDFYSKRVHAALGAGYDDHFRLWYNDYADHVEPHNPFLVSYWGILEQALRDVSAWAERDVPPPNSSSYEVVDNQVRLPANAAQRQGIQPVVDLAANGSAMAEIATGQTVAFTAKVELPPMSGEMVSTEWDFEGNGSFTTVPAGDSAMSVGSSTYTITSAYAYAKPGTFFPSLRVTTQREGDKDTSFARVQNLGRARVVVQNAGSDQGSAPVTANPPILIGEPNKIKANVPMLNASGIASTIVDAEVMAKALAAADDIHVTVPGVKDAAGYAVTLPASALTEETGAHTIEVETELGSVKLSSAMFAAAQLKGATEVTLSLKKADTDGLTDSVRAQIGDRPVLEVTLTAGGIVVPWINPDEPVTVFIPYTPNASELTDPEHIVVWFIDSHGGATAVPSGRYDAKRGGITFMTTRLGKYAAAFVTKSFGDITKQPWARQAIEVMASKGIITGTSASAFAPEAQIQRADFMLILVRALGLTARTEDSFTDVSADAYYAEALSIAKRLGVAQGVGGNRFNPEAPITRQDMMVLVDKALTAANIPATRGTSTDLDAFADKFSVAAYAQSSAATLYKNGIIKGDGSKVNPTGFATRAEAAVLAYRIYNLGLN
ncbi:S-layer homology domain-containing protein [Cohnella hashimotonis]|uniref:S-layer homology domain-containing protein n=1 Tax=Cohnella hashimotonis TaxID=2826895 RepID=A0ABT6THR3_9BACL|nr:S-layer homology domain-containing protein [Cohnella hashimotonis]MDI4646365.1 S-layer homology domain-containing protein [Cohnella hashimotonis]